VGVQVPLWAPIKSITYEFISKLADVCLDAGDTYGDTLYRVIPGEKECPVKSSNEYPAFGKRWLAVACGGFGIVSMGS
jgi:hypothetical protein